MPLSTPSLGADLAALDYADLTEVTLNRFPAPGESLADANQRLRERLKTPGRAVALDIETTSLQPASADDITNPPTIRTIQLGFDDPEQGVAREQVVIDCFSGIDLRPVLELLGDREVTKIIHYAPFEQKWILARYGVRIRNVFDTRAAWQILRDARGLHAGDAWHDLPSHRGLLADPDGITSNKLTNIIQHETGEWLPKEEQTAAWGGVMSDAMVEYAARDVAVLHGLARRALVYSGELGIGRRVFERAMEQEIRRGMGDARRNLRASAEGEMRSDVAIDDWVRVVEFVNACQSVEQLERFRAHVGQMKLFDAGFIKSLQRELHQDLRAERDEADHSLATNLAITARRKARQWMPYPRVELERLFSERRRELERAQRHDPTAIV
jgi:hypothetical protein